MAQGPARSDQSRPGPLKTGLRRELGFLPLVAVVFFNVSGGPYGIEEVVSSFGPGLALLLLVLTPLLWSLPVSLAMAELASALPDEGGYVAWVRRAFGPFWGFQVGWWSWINSFVDVAVYPALFADYLRFWWPDLPELGRWGLALGFIWLLTGLNLAGIRVVGRSAVALACCALLPVAVLTVFAVSQMRFLPWVPFAAESQGLWQGIGLGLAVMMWNYSGWDNPSTCLGETRTPETAYRRALFGALPLISLAYVLPVGAALAAAGDWTRWGTGYLPVVADAIGGRGLAGLVTLGALLATSGLFLSSLLTNSRLPFVLARAGQMPAWLAAVDTRSGTPRGAVILSSLCYSVFALWGFEELVVLDIWLYSLALLVELAAFVALRFTEPGLSRPWRVGGGIPGMWLTAALPSAVCLLAMATAGWMNTMVGVATALTGPAAYALWRARAPRPRSVR